MRDAIGVRFSRSGHGYLRIVQTAALAAAYPQSHRKPIFNCRMHAPCTPCAANTPDLPACTACRNIHWWAGNYKTHSWRHRFRIRKDLLYYAIIPNQSSYSISHVGRKPSYVLSRRFCVEHKSAVQHMLSAVCYNV